MAHILIVEDDPQFSKMLSQMLMQDHHRVTLARDGVEGLHLARQSAPDLIVTDILMPNSDGIDMIRALSEQGSTVPIIAISGGRRFISAEFNLESAALMGVKATLSKPFARAELRDTIAKILVQ